jgi:hypothetical protein
VNRAHAARSCTTKLTAWHELKGIHKFSSLSGAGRVWPALLWAQRRCDLFGRGIAMVVPETSPACWAINQFRLIEGNALFWPVCSVYAMSLVIHLRLAVFAVCTVVCPRAGHPHHFG